MRRRSVGRRLAGADARELVRRREAALHAVEAASLTVVHYDADFDHIAAVTGQPTEWVVERGSID